MEEPFRNNDQAKNLRQRMQDEERGLLQEPDPQELGEAISSLPSRNEVHKSKQTRMKWKIKYPFIRLLVFLFVVFILLIPLYYL
ncbi:hypothetical protein N780_12710 [Pontibacillus chungwhensis BH030062]|uniref:Uncharacterized protein n=1 Tax=Pontibacillus chungwhensis BH030062 TaxID=1385513 RepID=A0A0A2V2M9_9BACI|nr:hypothetical protein [Pontibacillus chungwhensis]KGP93303.1 hypothetical protein N780_12710 [Pontibacillus chungwhensis BH030062]